MVYTRRRPTRGMRRRPMRRRTIPRAPPRLPRVPSSMVTFTECLQAGDITTNAGGMFKVRMLDVPQVVSYSRLYSQFAIRKLRVVLLPKYGAAEPNAALVGVPAIDYQTGRFAFSINDSPAQINPTSELDVLTDNGAKVIVGGKKISITCYPKPDLSMLDANAGNVVATRIKSLRWLNFTNAEVGDTGEGVFHGAIRYWLTNQATLNQIPAYDVYYYVTFSVRDPL